jgi:hypothetical protein
MYHSHSISATVRKISIIVQMLTSFQRWKLFKRLQWWPGYKVKEAQIMPVFKMALCGKDIFTEMA